MSPHKIIFVCLGNICRSPTAEGALRKQVSERGLENLFEIDSAGTGDWHLGHPPDKRAIEAALARGIDLTLLRARQITTRDMLYYDTIIAMDNQNLARLKSLAPADQQYKVRLLLQYGNSGKQEIPDPYYGGDHGFDLVLDLIEASCRELLDKLLSDRQ